MLKRLLLSGTLVTAIVMEIACSGGLISGFKAGFAATKPFVQTLVTQQVISQAKADAVTRDVDDSIAFATTAQQCVNSAADKSAKATCILNLANSLRTVLQRHNIGGSPRLDQIAVIVRAAISAFQAYFDRVSNPSMGIMAGGADPDKQLEVEMKAINARFKAATQ